MIMYSYPYLFIDWLDKAQKKNTRGKLIIIINSVYCMSHYFFMNFKKTVFQALHYFTLNCIIFCLSLCVDVCFEVNNRKYRGSRPVSQVKNMVLHVAG